IMVRVVSLEGIDGSGKSFLVDRVESGLLLKGVEVVRLPSRYFFSRYHKGLSDAEVEQLQQDDKKHVYDKHVAKGTRVMLCDRAEVSQKVYNGTVNTSIESDKVIYLDIEVEKALERVNIRGEDDNLGFESKTILEAKKKEYERILKSDKYRNKVDWVKVEGNGYRL